MIKGLIALIRTVRDPELRGLALLVLVLGPSALRPGRFEPEELARDHIQPP